MQLTRVVLKSVRYNGEIGGGEEVTCREVVQLVRVVAPDRVVQIVPLANDAQRLVRVVNVYALCAQSAIISKPKARLEKATYDHPNPSPPRARSPSTPP